MNTFATLLLAFPFYLAIKGKLSSYIALAKPDASSSVADSQPSVSAPAANALSMTGNPTTAAPANPVANNDLANTMSNVTHIFANVADIAGMV